MSNSLLMLSVDQYDRFEGFAEMIVSSEAYTYHEQGKRKPLNKHDVVLKLMKGYELGLGMFESLTALYNEHGRLTLQVDAMMSLIRASGQLEFYKEKRTKNLCEIWAKRRGDVGDPVLFSYSYEDAKSMGLTKSANYKNQPDVMLYKRCASKMARTLFPDIISGIYAEGELTDGTDEEEEWDEPPTVEETADEIYDDEAFPEDVEDIDDETLEEEDFDEEDIEEEEISHFDTMVRKYNLEGKSGNPLTEREYMEHMEDFATWCVETLEDEDIEDIEEFVIDLLESKKFPLYDYVDESGDEIVILPWSPTLEEKYKSAIKTWVEINSVGFDEDEEEEIDLPEPEAVVEEDEIEEEIEDIIEELEDDNEEYEETDDDEEEMSWEDWDEDEWEEVEE